MILNTIEFTLLLRSFTKLHVCLVHLSNFFSSIDRWNTSFSSFSSPCTLRFKIKIQFFCCCVFVIHKLNIAHLYGCNGVKQEERMKKKKIAIRCVRTASLEAANMSNAKNRMSGSVTFCLFLLLTHSWVLMQSDSVRKQKHFAHVYVYIYLDKKYTSFVFVCSESSALPTIFHSSIQSFWNDTWNMLNCCYIAFDI